MEELVILGLFLSLIILWVYLFCLVSRVERESFARDNRLHERFNEIAAPKQLTSFDL